MSDYAKFLRPQTDEERKISKWQKNKDLETLKLVPFGGKHFYWQFGAGAKREANRNKPKHRKR